MQTIRHTLDAMDVLAPNPLTKDKSALVKVLSFLGLFLIYLLLMTVLLPAGFFIDEMDNFIGGMIVGNGGSVYLDHTSQHMPFMYYICALFYRLGATNGAWLRMAGYAFLALIFAAMYVRYGKRFSRVALALYPVLYILMMAWYTPCSNSMISDQLQAQGMVILLLEYLLFVRTRELKPVGSVWIALSIVFSFGTTFVSAYSIALIALSVFVLEIADCVKNKRGFAGSVTYLWMKYWLTLALVMLPFVMLLIVYAIKGSLGSFIYQAYTINRTIYPEYIGGYGASAFEPFFSCFRGYFDYVVSAARELAGHLTPSIRVLSMIAANIGFTLLLLRKNWFAGLTAFYYALLCAPRGFVGFHSLGFYGVSFLMGALMIGKWSAMALRALRSKKLRALYAAEALGVLMMIAAISAPYLSWRYTLSSIPDMLFHDTPSEYTQAIQSVTEPEDKLYIPNLNITYALDAKRVPLMSAAASVPWMYRGVGENEFARLQAYKPKTIVYDKDYTIWGYSQKDYAPELTAWIEENYTCCDEEKLPLLYVRNDLLDSAREKLQSLAE